MNKYVGIRIIHSSEADYINKMVKEGWVPVECSIGGDSIVDTLKMDHHGLLSDLEGVAVRAYRDHFGECSGEKAKFVVTGAPDADQTFAIAALAGLLPHPSRTKEFEGAPPFISGPMTRSLLPLAEIIDRVDCDPIENPFDGSEEYRLLNLWQQLSSGREDRSAVHSGVDRWLLLTGPRCPEQLVKASGDQEGKRVQEAANATILFPTEGEIPLVMALTCAVWGFDVWYAHYSRCVVALNPHDGNITVGCASLQDAEYLFGPGGLKNMFPLLDEQLSGGWGGRETIGGSPRGRKMSDVEAIAAANILLKEAMIYRARRE